MAEAVAQSPAGGKENPPVRLDDEFRKNLIHSLGVDVPKDATMNPDTLRELRTTYEQWIKLGGDGIMQFEFSPIWQRQKLGGQLPQKPPPQRPAVPPEQMREVLYLRNRMIVLIANSAATPLILDAIPETGREPFEHAWNGVTAVLKKAEGASADKRFELDKNVLNDLDDFRNKANLALANEKVQGTATEGSLRKGLQTVELIKSLDPLRAKEWDVMRKRQEGSGILDKPLRLAVGGIATVLFIMALIPTIRKMVRGQNVTATDIAFTAAYAAAAAVALGIWPKGKQMELEQYANDTFRLMHPSYQPFWALVNDTIGKDRAIAAVRELHDRLEGNPGFQNNLERALSTDTEMDFVMEEFGEKSEITQALKKCQTPEQRHRFLRIILSVNLAKESGRNTLVDLLQRAEEFVMPAGKA